MQQQHGDVTVVNGNGLAAMTEWAHIFSASLSCLLERPSQEPHKRSTQRLNTDSSNIKYWP